MLVSIVRNAAIAAVGVTVLMIFLRDNVALFGETTPQVSAPATQPDDIRREEQVRRDHMEESPPADTQEIIETAQSIAPPEEPAEPQYEDSGEEMTIPPGPHGHYFVDAEVNGASVPFMIDTGASVVALSPDVLPSMDINIDDLDFTLRMSTANGTAMAAPLMLERVQVGGLIMSNVQAVVMDKPMGQSLLGMSFLSRLNGYQVERGMLILKY